MLAEQELTMYALASCNVQQVIEITCECVA